MKQNETSSYERLCNRMAELFVERFSSIVDGNCRSIIENVFPHQNMDGVVFGGSNALTTAMVASGRGYGIPVWFTMNRVQTCIMRRSGPKEGIEKQAEYAREWISSIKRYG